MLKLLFWTAPRGQRKQQMAAWAVASAVTIIVVGLLSLEDVDLVGLAILAGAPAAGIQTVHAVSNVKAKATRNGASE